LGLSTSQRCRWSGENAIRAGFAQLSPSCPKASLTSQSSPEIHGRCSDPSAGGPGDCAALWASFQAVGGHPALSVLILAYMLGQLGNTLPLPGGMSGVEPLMLGIFASSGVDLGLAGAAVICYRAIALGVQGALGAVAFGAVAFVSLGSDLRQERHRALAA
jgi:hypothetical protein